MVLRSMPSPAWLALDAPDGDVVVSTRVRHARNLKGFRFPHLLPADEARAVDRAVRGALEQGPLPLRAMQRLTEAERDFLVGSRLISVEFPHREPGRTVLLDEGQGVSVMVNEEDHVRLQALTAGWSAPHADARANDVLATLEAHLPLAYAEPFGWLTASPSNVGEGCRRSALFHLIGLNFTKRLNQVLQALAASNVTARGLYGESSRAVGGFFQVSATTGSAAEFMGACEYLIGEERRARREVTRLTLAERTAQAREVAIGSGQTSAADALRILAWLRWGASAGIPDAPASPREVDHWVATMEIHGTQDPATAARHRADFLRHRVESITRRATPEAS